VSFWNRPRTRFLKGAVIRAEVKCKTPNATNEKNRNIMELQECGCLLWGMRSWNGGHSDPAAQSGRRRSGLAAPKLIRALTT